MRCERILLAEGRDMSCCFWIRSFVCFRFVYMYTKLKRLLEKKNVLGSKQLIWNVTSDEIRPMLRAAFIGEKSGFSPYT